MTRAAAILCLLLCSAASTLHGQVQDRSDAVFSIVMPAAEAGDVDMGRVTVGAVRDSLVRAYLRNTGRARIRIDSLYIDGASAALFAVSSGRPPVFLPVSGTHDVAFSFMPVAAGTFEADIVVHTQVDTQRYRIHGEAVSPQIDLLVTAVDFGAVRVGAERDSTITALLRNPTAGPVTVTASENSGPDDQQFSVLSGAAPVTIPPFGTHAMALRFAPQRPGRSSGSISFRVDGMPDAAVARLFGEGIAVTASAVLSTDTLLGAVGELVTVPIRLQQGANLQLSGARELYTELRLRASVLLPIGSTPQGRLEGDERVIPLEGLLLLPLRDDIIAEYTFLAVLGTEETTSLVLEAAAAVGGSVDIAVVPGSFTLTDICREGGDRFFDAGGQLALTQIGANPFNAATAFRVTVIERLPFTVRMLDLRGRVVGILHEGAAAPGSYVYTFDGAELPSGVYLCELRSGNAVRRVPVTLLK